MKNLLVLSFLLLGYFTFANSTKDSSKKKNKSQAVSVKVKKDEAWPSLCTIRRKKTSIGNGGSGIRVIWVVIDCQTGKMRKL